MRRPPPDTRHTAGSAGPGLRGRRAGRPWLARRKTCCWVRGALRAAGRPTSPQAAAPHRCPGTGSTGDLRAACRASHEPLGSGSTSMRGSKGRRAATTEVSRQPLLPAGAWQRIPSRVPPGTDAGPGADCGFGGGSRWGGGAALAFLRSSSGRQSRGPPLPPFLLSDDRFARQIGSSEAVQRQLCRVVKSEYSIPTRHERCPGAYVGQRRRFPVTGKQWLQGRPRIACKAA